MVLPVGAMQKAPRSLLGTAMAILELPALYVDALTTEVVGSALVITNKVPGPSEVDVPANSSLWIRVVDAGGIGVDNLDVYVSGVLVYTGGAAVGGSGFSAATLAVTDGFKVQLTKGVGWASLESVLVRVVANRTAFPAVSIDESWTFTAEDTEAPQILQATAIDQCVVQIEFNEAVSAAGAAVSFVAVTAPAVPIVAVSFVAVGSKLDVVTDIPMTPGATYQLTATVPDLAGNADIEAATFDGFTPQQPARRSFSSVDFVPERQLVKDDEGTGDLRKWLAVLQDMLFLVLSEADRFPDILSHERAPESFLDRILSDLGNPFEFQLSVDQKRLLADVLVDLYRQKGTKIGIENAIRFFVGVEATVVEFSAIGMKLGTSKLNFDWVLGASESRALYSFRIDVAAILTDEQLRQVTTIAQYMKTAHTHLVEVREDVPPALWTLDVSALDTGTVLG